MCLEGRIESGMNTGRFIRCIDRGREFGASKMTCYCRERLMGFADTHNHQFANLAFGGKMVWGEPAGPIETALGHCTKEHGVRGLRDLKGYLRSLAAHMVLSCLLVLSVRAGAQSSAPVSSPTKTPSINVSAEPKKSSVEQSDTEIEGLKQDIAELKRKVDRPPKDFWDKFATLSTFLSGVLISLIGLYITLSSTRTLTVAPPKMAKIISSAPSGAGHSVKSNSRPPKSANPTTCSPGSMVLPSILFAPKMAK
jgi:hypothetical protein